MFHEPEHVQIPASVADRLRAEEKRIADKLGKSRRRRVLLIGGLGYIGGPLTSHLLSIGYEVTSLDLLVYRQGSGFLS